MDPYRYGAWLGDGSRNRLDWCVNHRDTEIVDAIQEFAVAKGLRVRETPGRGCSNYHVTQGNIGQVRQIDEFYFVQGSSHADGKRIDRRYLVNDRDTRLQLLAGIVDTDGNLKDGCLSIGTKWTDLRDDILFLSQSLGLSASHGSQTVDGVEYYTICLSGHTDMVPCRTRKKAPPHRQIKDPIVYGFSVASIGVGEYFGFELDGDHLYLLGDFTVTHNTATNLAVMRQTARTAPACAV